MTLLDYAESPNPLTPAQRRRSMEWITIAWLFGGAWYTGIAGAPFTVYANALGAGPMHFGFIAAMPFVAAIISLPASLWIDASGDRKRIFLIAMLMQRFSWWGIAAVPIFLTRFVEPPNPTLALLVFLALFGLSAICGSIGGPAWVSWMADIVPSRIRGRYFGRRRQLGLLSSAPTALLCGLIVDRFVPAGDKVAALWWCGGLMATATFAGVVDIVIFHWIPPVHHAPRCAVPIWHTLVRPLKDKHFLWFCAYVATLVAAVAPMGQFTTLYLIERLGVSATQVQLMLLVMPMLGQFFIVPIWGTMADRYGRKPMMAIATLGLVPVGLGWCAMNLGYAWLGYTLAVAGSMLWAAVEMANFNLVIEMSGSKGTDDNEAGGSGYNSVNSVILAIAGTIGGLGAGSLMSGLKDVRFTLGFNLERPFGPYEILFAASALLRLIAAVVFLPKVHEPDARSTRDAIEFMADNMYASIMTAVLAPIRRFIPRGK